MKYEINKGEILVCPVCGKEFTATEDSKYIVDGEFTCSWKCFTKYVKKFEKEDLEKHSKRGRKPKRKPIDFRRRDDYDD